MTRPIERALAGAARADERGRRARPARGTRRPCSTGVPGVVLEATRPRTRRRRARRRRGSRVASSSSSVAMSRISRMRSRPANASVICVPIDAICTSGAATQAGEEDVHDEVAERHRRRRGSRGRRRAIISTPIDADDHASRTRSTAETPVIDFATLRNSRCDAAREDELLALLGGVGLDDADAAERLGEPAGDLGVDLAALAEERPQPREGAAPSCRRTPPSTTSVTSVSCQLR